MRTGRFRFVEERRWWQRAPRQVLYVEVSSPDGPWGCGRIVEWIRGTASDACTIEATLNSRARRNIRRAA